ncbi:MAG: HAD-IIB family hydrolase [Sphingomonas sp.]
MPLFLMSIALGGCLKGPPVEFGITEDTGGHITYILGASFALAAREDVERVEIVTRLIDDPVLGPAYAIPHEQLSDKLAIVRMDTGDRAYLSKEANAADRPAFICALTQYIAGLERKPDVIHAHFADAGMVAIALRERFGIPFVYTAHSLGIDKAGAGEGGVAIGPRIVEEDAVIAAADAIVASSRDEAERQLMLYPGACPAKIHRMPPGAALAAEGSPDVDRARALIAPFLRAPGKPMVLAIARPVRKKNLAGLVELYAADPALREKANLVIVAGLRDGPDCGEAEQRGVIGELLAAMDRHDLYGSLALPKRHAQADVAALYALARDGGGVFVNPALTEPYGLTLTEAATHGLPVVATCHGGAADIVASLGHGLVADPCDAPAFAAAIHHMLDDRAAWGVASRQGRANGAARDWNGYAARFLAVARALAPKDAATPAASFAELLLCDIDNTLTGCPTGARRMAGFLERRPALAFGVATGRSLQEAERLLREWGQPDPCVLITSVGAEIYWRRGGRLAPDRGYTAHIDAGWDRAAVEARVRGLRGVAPQPPVEQRRHKSSWFASEPAVVAAIREAVADLPVRVIHSHGDLLDIVPERAGKGSAMTWAAQAMGIAPDRVFAAGDSGNDLDMLSLCMNAIIVANHSEELTPLLRRPTTYLSRRPHAGGVMEGVRAWARRRAA